MTPDYHVCAEGRDITAAIRDRLLSLVVTDYSGLKADEVTIRLDDRDARIELPRRGVELAISLGTVADGLTEMGTFTVVGLSAAGPRRTLTISAKSADLTGAIRAPRTASWTDVTLNDIHDTIGPRYGLKTPTHVSVKDHHYDHVAQTAESDLNLLTRLARDLGCVLKLVENNLAIVPIGWQETSSGTEFEVVEIAAQMASSWSWRIGERTEYAAVRAWWQDLAAAERKPEIAGTGAPEYEIRHTYATRDAALRAAHAKLEELTRAKTELAVQLARPMLDLSAERPVRITGFRDGVDCRWTVERAEHRLEGGGLATRLDLRPPTRGVMT